MNVSSSQPISPEAATRPARILIVEDERLVALSLGMQLRALGYDVVATVPSGEAAIHGTEYLQPDLVLMDIRLEGEIDGIQAAADIWNRYDLPIVYLTAFSDTETLARAKITEPFGYILKPVNERELHVAIECSLYKHRMESERSALREADRRRHEDRMSSLETLAAGIAHEINNPIGTILLAAEMGLTSEAHAQQALSSIVADAKRCGDIVRNVLRFARGESMEKHSTDLNGVIRAAAAATAEYLRSLHCSLHTALAADLPPANLNFSAIEQVVENLLRNAAEASAAGNPIEIRSECAGDFAQIIVRDWGTGIAPDVLQRIRDPFYTTRRSLGGTGLGLSIAHGIVAEHGGTMRIKSALGQGTTVTVGLPAELAAASRRVESHDRAPRQNVPPPW